MQTLLARQCSIHFDKHQKNNFIAHIEFNFSDVYRRVNYIGNSGFMQTLLETQCSIHFDKHQKNNFIAHIYINCNQNLDENSYISAKIKIMKHFPAVLLLTAEQRRRLIRLYRAMVYFGVTDAAWLDVVIVI